MRGTFVRLILSVLLLTACTSNLIGSFTNPNSDAALYQSALDNINSSNWKTAITDIQAMSPSGQSSRTVMFTFATALAGQCGFQLIPFMTDLQNAWSGGGTPSAIMLTLMDAYQGATINLAVGSATPTAATDPTTESYCAWSQQVMDNIQTNYGAWNSDEQTFVLFYSLAKVGMILKNFAGTTNNMAGGIMIPDATFNACATANLPDFYAVQISTGLALFLKYYTNISFLSSLTYTVGGTTYTLPTIFCGTTSPSFAMNFCNHLTPSTVTANDILNIRGMITSAAASAGVVNLYNPVFQLFTVMDGSEATKQAEQTVPSTPPGYWQCTNANFTSPSYGTGGAEGLLNCCL